MYRVRGRAKRKAKPFFRRVSNPSDSDSGSLDQAEDSRIRDQGLGSWFVGLGKVVAVVVVSPSLFPSQCQDVAVREGDGRI